MDFKWSSPNLLRNTSTKYCQIYSTSLLRLHRCAFTASKISLLNMFICSERLSILLSIRRTLESTSLKNTSSGLVAKLLTSSVLDTVWFTSTILGEVRMTFSILDALWLTSSIFAVLLLLFGVSSGTLLGSSFPYDPFWSELEEAWSFLNSSKSSNLRLDMSFLISSNSPEIYKM